MISRRAKLLEIGLRVAGVRGITSRMILNPKRNKRYEHPPKSFYRKYTVESCIIDQTTCVTLKQNFKNKRQILYFPGGAYTLSANRAHWSIVERFAQEAQCDITLINYPLAPENTCLNTVGTALKVYEHFCKNSEAEMILMGDSAGGGLALSLAQQIQEAGNLPEPDKLVLFSPWLDVSMEVSSSTDLERYDLLLSKEALKVAGRRYSGKLDLKDSLCSPLYGSCYNIGEIALFTGTKDILHEQATWMRKSFVANRRQISYYEYKGMQHVWVLFPIPEAEHALNIAVSFINRQREHKNCGRPIE